MIILMGPKNFRVRYDMFETNSSSTHSYVLRKREYPNSVIETDDPLIHVYLDYYDWGFQILRSPLEKLSYLLTYARAVDFPWDKKFVTFDEFKESEGYKIINEAVKAETHKDVFPTNTDSSNNGIDHQSIYFSTVKELLDSFPPTLASNTVDMAKYIIFNPHVEIWITNDNCDLDPSYDEFRDTVENDPLIKLQTGEVSTFKDCGIFFIEE